MITESRSSACLEVNGLCITYPGAGGPIEVVRDARFSLAEARCLGIVGESGSGKSQSCLSVMGLLPRHAHVTGSIRFRGHELLGNAAPRMQEFRG
ncbi:MAG: ABC transporter ATP-binding protein, partial [Proteobacteria bacterium]|nr:ABC transporter ATP-binding protein [Pseudomonadota bacterium]